MHSWRPLSVLLAQALIAFTIELDNEWEARMPHRTTDHGGSGVWGTSLLQWSNFMQYVAQDGISMRELTRLTRARPHLNGMSRWGYVTVGEDRIVRPTSRGIRAQEVWRGLPDEIEQRWVQRLGGDFVGGLRRALEPFVRQSRGRLPDWLTAHYGGYANGPVLKERVAVEAPLPLSAVLSIPLHALTLLYERESDASLCFTVNILRLLGSGDGVAVASLPQRSGVALVSVRTAIGQLQRAGLVERSGSVVRRTSPGLVALLDMVPISREIEATMPWAGAVRPLLEDALSAGAPLWPSIDPPRGSWRLKVPRPEVLPWHPIPRQGGHPDGA
jgi:hypothetical protein